MNCTLIVMTENLNKAVGVDRVSEAVIYLFFLFFLDDVSIFKGRP